ncbi:hypothetical protein [Geminocystis sp. GBBB08]|uniref:hypothetical protein n=1 Tax=Geminocystis sp. GBBB08 TaxID=2604140 RepID=UPI0027E25F7E|nr:hypothetical protein [Geminocystis sp. GBBB08]MBL1210525.1 hypothetical protein [Geminocystis sp. GBBB08]
MKISSDFVGIKLEKNIYSFYLPKGFDDFIEQYQNLDDLENINIISVLNNNFTSKYVPFISFQDNEQKQKGNYYILRTVENCFRTIQVKIPNLISSYLDYSKLITDLDFNDYKNINISYFYDKFFFDLGDRDENNKLIIPIKWTVTFDINYTPIKVPELIIPNSGNLCRHFGTIDVGGTPILYYIYFTMQEILNTIRDNE